MDVSKINSLVELYFKKAEQIDKKKPFLKWLNPKNNHQYNYDDRGILSCPITRFWY